MSRKFSLLMGQNPKQIFSLCMQFKVEDLADVEYLIVVAGIVEVNSIDGWFEGINLSCMLLFWL